MMAKTEQSTLARTGRPRVGDFTVIIGKDDQKLRLTECPICALDPARPRKVFTTNSKPHWHFLREHEADDVGRPMTELLPELSKNDRGRER